MDNVWINAGLIYGIIRFLALISLIECIDHMLNKQNQWKYDTLSCCCCCFGTEFPNIFLDLDKKIP